MAYGTQPARPRPAAGDINFSGVGRLALVSQPSLAPDAGDADYAAREQRTAARKERGNGRCHCARNTATA